MCMVETVIVTLKYFKNIFLINMFMQSFRISAVYLDTLSLILVQKGCTFCQLVPCELDETRSMRQALQNATCEKRTYYKDNSLAHLRLAQFLQDKSPRKRKLVYGIQTLIKG
jgi:hypothetical protein